VEVVPVTVGRNAVPPPGWSQLCAKMKIGCTPRKMWARVQTCVVEHNIKMFSMWQHCNGLRA